MYRENHGLSTHARDRILFVSKIEDKRIRTLVAQNNRPIPKHVNEPCASFQTMSKDLKIKKQLPSTHVKRKMDAKSIYFSVHIDNINCLIVLNIIRLEIT